ncbi:MAG TPA: EAL domain-containing protein, partial [Thermoanaerobaculia bacterium]
EELELALGDNPTSTAAYDVIRIPPIDEILRGDAITPVFQPIVRMTESGISSFGFEALTRVRGRWLAGGPVMLFDYAARRAKLADLNIVAMTRAMHMASLLPEDSTLFINIDPLTFDGRQLVPALKAAARQSSMPFERVILEVTERSAFPDDAIAGRVFDELRDLGLRFALDDHGSAYSHLGLINKIRPSFIKMSQTFGTDFEDDVTKGRIVRHTVALARDFGCDTILEGIESGKTARAAAELGVTYAQGFHFGRPRAAGHWVAAKATLRAA